VEKLRSRIILAIDNKIEQKLIIKLSEYIYGIKIGLPLILELGIIDILNIIKNLKVETIIIDLKLADIGDIMNKIVSKLIEVGDSFIAHSIVGIEDALDKLKEYLDKNNKKLFLVASMTHRGWKDFLYENLIKDIIMRTDPFGLVAPATKIEMLRKIREDFPKKIIISPGIGYQGAKPGIALCHGSDYEIIGRRILNSSNPVLEIEQIIEEQRRNLNECKKGNVWF
jgi:orotidine-5'-phosphate decarboxylase